ncbi:MAG: hypothetical protein ACREME_03830, partial [Gemmatimonadales bacterium]
MTATAAIVAGTVPASAQYAPYRPIPKQPAEQQPAAQPAAPTAAAQTPYTAWQTSQATPPYRPAVAPYSPAGAQQPQAAAQYAPASAQYPHTAAPYVPTAPYAPSTPPAPQTVVPYQPAQPTYPAVARQPNNGAPTPAEGETMPEPSNGAPMNGGPNGAEMQNGQPAPVEYQNGYNGYPHGYPANGCYPATTGYNHGNVDYGVSSYFDNPCHDSQWFGGVYFLFMERDNASPVKLTVEVDHAVVVEPYYPPATTTVVSTHQTNHDFREGVEVRVGSTFTISEPCDTYNTGCGPAGYGGCHSCAPCAVDVYAWEVAWWGLDDDAEVYTFEDELPLDGRRIYGMKNFVGLEYDRDGAGVGYSYQPVNGYYGYALPILDPDVVDPPPREDGYLTVLAQRVRTNFRAQNLELNIIRFPVCEMACGGCNTGCGPGAGCDAGGGSEYGAAGCEEECYPSTFSMYGSCGVRYFRVDDDFMYANEFTEWA